VSACCCMGCPHRTNCRCRCPECNRAPDYPLIWTIARSPALCPVCGGSGSLPVSDLQGYPVTTTGGTLTKPCHGCAGKGWVVVP